MVPGGSVPIPDIPAAAFISLTTAFDPPDHISSWSYAIAVNEKQFHCQRKNAEEEPFSCLIQSKYLPNSTLETGQQLKAAMEAMEKGLEIQGVTAIEDKLQDGVPDALNCLRKAGTKVCSQF